MANFVYVDSCIDGIRVRTEKPWHHAEIKRGIEISHYRTLVRLDSLPVSKSKFLPSVAKIL